MNRLKHLVLAASLVGTCGCGEGGTALRPAAVPDCWQPFGQAQRPALTPEAIGKGSIVLKARHPKDAVAVYDAKAEKWQAYRLPPSTLLASEPPHIWHVKADGTAVYWNPATGFRRRFTGMPYDLLVPHGPRLVDQAIVPAGQIAAGKWWTWRAKEKAYVVFDPNEGQWRPLPSSKLPPGLAVWAAEEDDRRTWLLLGAVAYCTMRPPPGRLFVLDKAAGKWVEVENRDRKAWARLRPLASEDKGMWVRRGDGSLGFWDAGKRAFTKKFAYTYGVVGVGGRLWGVGANSRDLVIVKGVDAKTGRPVPELVNHVSNLDRRPIVYDGRHLWRWERTPTGAVTRYNPQTRKRFSYPTVTGLVGPVAEIRFTRRAIWFDLARFDRAKKTWRTFTWKDGLPHDVTRLLPAVGEQASFLLVARGPTPYQYCGIAHYDPGTDKLTHYDAAECVKPDWPHVDVSAAVPARYAREPLRHKLLLVWEALAEADGLRPSPDVVTDEAAYVKDGKLHCRDLNTGQVAVYPQIAWIGRNTVVTEGAIFQLVRDRRAAMLLDRKTRKRAALGPRLPKDARLRQAVRHKDEVWFTWARWDGRSAFKGFGAARLDLAGRKLMLLGNKDRRPFGAEVTPFAMDDRWRWGLSRDPKARSRTGSRGRTFVVGQDRKTGRWVRVDYLDGRIWSDGPTAYANINGRLHRAAKKDFYDTLRPG